MFNHTPNDTTPRGRQVGQIGHVRGSSPEFARAEAALRQAGLSFTVDCPGAAGCSCEALPSAA